MYAVVETGGKQYRVSQGQNIEVERLASPGSVVSLRPVLFVDGARVLAKPSELLSVSVNAVVLGEHRGPKIRGFVYKSKSNQRKRWGHRQTLSTINITDIRCKTDITYKNLEEAGTAQAATQASTSTEKGN